MYLLLTNGTPFTYLVYNLHPFQKHSLLITIKSQNQNVLPLFHSHKMHLLAVWAYLQTKITYVPTLSYTSTSEIATLSYT